MKQNFDKMNKKELVKVIEDQEQVILDLQIKLETLQTGTGRKSQVLELLRISGPISILTLSSKLNISTKNVSSQLTYLRSDGFQIFTDPNGKKVLFEETEETKETKETEETEETKETEETEETKETEETE